MLAPFAILRVARDAPVPAPASAAADHAVPLVQVTEIVPVPSTAAPVVTSTSPKATVPAETLQLDVTVALPSSVSVVAALAGRAAPGEDRARLDARRAIRIFIKTSR